MQHGLDAADLCNGAVRREHLRKFTRLLWWHIPTILSSALHRLNAAVASRLSPLASSGPTAVGEDSWCLPPSVSDAQDIETGLSIFRRCVNCDFVRKITVPIVRGCSERRSAGKAVRF